MKRLNSKDLSLESKLRDDLNLTSMQLIELVTMIDLEIHQNFGLEVAKGAKIETIGDIVKILESLK